MRGNDTYTQSTTNASNGNGVVDERRFQHRAGANSINTAREAILQAELASLKKIYRQRNNGREISFFKSNSGNTQDEYNQSLLNEIYTYRRELNNNTTSANARRDLLRAHNLPTSLQPTYQNNFSQTYIIPYEKVRENYPLRFQRFDLQNQTRDRNHTRPHWELGNPKLSNSSPRTMEELLNPQTNNYGNVQLQNTHKMRSEYDR